MTTDLSRDARALFKALRSRPKFKEGRKREWVFYFSHPDVDFLLADADKFPDALSKEMAAGEEAISCEYDPEPVKMDEHGSTSIGDPLFKVRFEGGMTEEQLASIHQTFLRIAADLGINYYGVQVD